jgi:hypothetical protein
MAQRQTTGNNHEESYHDLETQEQEILKFKNELKILEEERKNLENELKDF